MKRIRVPLPPDFKDRPRWERWWVTFLILIRQHAIKTECCESFRKPEKMMACKGCRTLYHRDSPYFFYRLAARIGKYRLPKTKIQ